MNKGPFLCLAVCLGALLFPSGSAPGYDDPQNKEDSGKPYGEGSHAPVEVPPGMELIKIGNMRVIAPQGTKFEKKGSLVVMEGSDEFAARNFKEMGARFEKTEASQDELRKTVDALKQEIAELRKKEQSGTA